ncbi:MAG TPA: hypothetical protein VK335_31375 [Bryobacteraceae bacterium]|nr:hypothetical protein [Bryobacteraceae bacterium]
MKRLLCAAAFLAVPVPLLCQLAMPTWLATYPGATAETNTSSALLEVTYTTAATPDAVSEHYRKLFEAEGLPFVPNSDGMGVTIRGAAQECDLLITIHGQRDGTFVSVSCAAKSQASESTAVPTVITTTGSGTGKKASRHAHVLGQSRAQTEEDFKNKAAETMAENQARVAEFHQRTYSDAPAPPLVWPDWLVHMDGAKPALEQCSAQGNDGCLGSKYRSSAPMTAIYKFYMELLKAHGYAVDRARMGTGQTQSGIRQNADGYVEGSNYPNGSPGARSEIRVNFSRWVLNEPITVSMRFRVYAHRGSIQRVF